MQFYNEIFQHSWKITMKHKFLWWFGFFTLLWSGKGIESEIFFTNARALRDLVGTWHARFWQEDFWRALVQLVQRLFGASINASEQMIIVMAILVIVALMVLVLVVMMMAQIGLVDAFAAYETNKKVHPVHYTLSHAMQVGSKHWRAVLVANILGRGLSYALLVLSVAPLLVGKMTTIKLFLSFLFFIILTIASVLVALITRYTVNYIVLKNLSLNAAVSAAVTLARTNIWISLELALFMVAMYFVANFAALVAAVVVTLPIMFVAFLSVFSLHSVVGVYVYLYFVLLAVIYALILSSVVFATWHAGNWTLLFLQLTKGKKQARIHRFLVGERSTVAVGETARATTPVVQVVRSVVGSIKNTKTKKVLRRQPKPPVKKTKKVRAK